MKTELTAAGLSRVAQHIQNYDCGTISACRNYAAEAYYQYGSKAISEMSDEEKDDLLSQFVVSPTVNKKNTFLLRQKLTVMGFGVLPITGVYQEKGADLSKEVSFFVFDVKQKGNLKKALLYLGNLFDQDSITYADAGGDFKLLDTTPFFEQPGRKRHRASGEVILSFKGIGYHTPSSADVGQFFSRLKNKAFFWKNITSIGTEIESSVHNPYTSPQARVNYPYGILQSSIWTPKSYARRMEDLITAGADVDGMYDLNIIEEALTENGVASSVYVEK